MKLLTTILLTIMVSSVTCQVIPEEIHKQWVLADIIQGHNSDSNAKYAKRLGTQQSSNGSNTTLIFKFSGNECVRSVYPEVSPYLDTTQQDRDMVVREKFQFDFRNDSLLLKSPEGELLKYKVLKLNPTELVLMISWFDKLTNQNTKRWYYFHKRNAPTYSTIINNFENDWWNTWIQSIDELLVQDTIKLYKQIPEEHRNGKYTSFIFNFRFYSDTYLKIYRSESELNSISVKGVEERFYSICPDENVMRFSLHMKDKWVKYEIYTSKDTHRLVYPPEGEMWLVKLE